MMKFDMIRKILAGATLVLVCPGSVHADELFEKVAVLAKYCLYVVLPIDQGIVQS